MTVKLNHGAGAHAQSLIESGKYDDSSPWSFDGADGDKLLGPDGDDWASYRKWFLGEDDGPSNEKATYSYPFGKDGKVYGQALRAIRSRASQQGATDIFDEAGRLLDLAKKPDTSAKIIPFYKMKAADSVGEILLYQDIGEGFWTAGTTAASFAADLKALGKVNLINCRINSPGGNVFDGITIYNLLASHPARVVVHVDGLAASIASVIAMAGDEINIADNGMMMIHNAWGGGFGPAADLRQIADTLDAITDTIAATYVKRSGMKLDKVKSMMDAETWMNAQEARDCGLATNVVDNMQIAARISPTKKVPFKNIPKAILTEAPSAAMPRREKFAARLEALKVNSVAERLRQQRNQH